MQVFENHPWALREPCKRCGCDRGFINTVSGQDKVTCERCGIYQYMAPKSETGRETRTVSTGRKLMKPKKRSRLIDRANGRCERCGKPGYLCNTSLHIGHVVSVEDGKKYGLTEKEINSDENLIVECDECNLAHGKEPVPLRIYVAILRNRWEQLNG